MLPESINNLAQKLRGLSGVGLKSSQRMALDILQFKDDDFSNLLNNMQEARQKVKFCERCGFFAEEKLCSICSNARRDQLQICIVEKPTDIISLEKSEAYSGVYHVLNKLISPLDNVFAEDTTINELMLRIESLNANVELIMFLKPSFASEATTAYIKELIQHISSNKNSDKKITVTRMAQGLPLYYNPETLDTGTMVRALEDRRIV